MPIRYIGRESHFHGKSLYEIARNLKNFGEGRYVYRLVFSNRYKEPSFYKLTSVVPDMNAKGYCKGKAAGEKIFRGQNYGVCNIGSGMKHDWRLIPKDQEQVWLDSLKNCEVRPQTVVQAVNRLPPLMEKIFRDEMLSDGLEVDESTFIYNTVIQNRKYNNAVLGVESTTSSTVHSDTK